MNITKQELEQFYIIENHSRQETLDYFKISLYKLKQLLKKFELKKPKELASILSKKTKLEKYGDENYNNRIQSKETCIEHFGVDNPNKNKEIYLKGKQTKLEKYGDENYNNSAKNRETAIKNFGGVGFESTILRTKIEQKRVDKFGSIEEARKVALEKAKETNLERYNVDNPFKSSNLMARAWLKGFETKKLNGTTNTSNPEEQFYSRLLEFYKPEDIERQYFDEKRYPFHCDFYIKSEDLFIELNLFWTHGKHKFDANNKDDIEILNCWNEKSLVHDCYKSAIHCWTVSDPLKFKYAEDNNLNYIAIYKDEFNYL